MIHFSPHGRLLFVGPTVRYNSTLKVSAAAAASAATAAAVGGGGDGTVGKYSLVKRYSEHNVSNW